MIILLFDFLLLKKLMGYEKLLLHIAMIDYVLSTPVMFTKPNLFEMSQNRTLSRICDLTFTLFSYCISFTPSNYSGVGL